MKHIVITTSVFPPEYPADQALDRLTKVGYTHLDMAFDYCSHPASPFMGEGWRREWAVFLRKQADALGVSYTHAHACGDAASRSVPMLRCFEVCALLGIRYLVVHPIFQAEGKVITMEICL